MAETAPRPGLRGAEAGGAIATAPVIALTSGEPAGVGPELCTRLAAERFPARLVAIGDRTLLQGFPEVEHVPLAQPRVPGKLDPKNSRYVLAVLERALAGCLSGEYQAMVTAPVQKSVINDAGIAFTGHTEFLAERARAPHVVMMLVGGGLRVALATTHLPLSEVPKAITRELIVKTLRVLDADLRRRFRVAKPRILVAGLNRIFGSLEPDLPARSLLVATGAFALALGFGVWAQAPTRGLWLISICVALDFLCHGATWVWFSMLVRGRIEAPIPESEEVRVPAKEPAQLQR